MLLVYEESQAAEYQMVQYLRNGSFCAARGSTLPLHTIARSTES